MNKNVCVVEIVREGPRGEERLLHFWPYYHWSALNEGAIKVPWWPTQLGRQFSALGLYSISRVPSGTKGAVKVGIKYAANESPHPATWIDGDCAVCQGFLDHLGVKTPEGWKQRHFWLKVTKI